MARRASAPLEGGCTRQSRVLLGGRSGKRCLISSATVLMDEAIELGGLKIYGSPMTPLYGAAFGKSSPVDRIRHWARIPDDIDVLITHGPPKGVLDRPPDQEEGMGDPQLMARVKELPSLRLHCFGHVHSAYGKCEKDGVVFVNVALMGLLGDIDRPPVVLRYVSMMQLVCTGYSAMSASGPKTHFTNSSICSSEG